MGTYRRNPDLSLTGFTSTKETERSPRGCIKTKEERVREKLILRDQPQIWMRLKLYCIILKKH